MSQTEYNSLKERKKELKWVIDALNMRLNELNVIENAQNRDDVLENMKVRDIQKQIEEYNELLREAELSLIRLILHA